MVRYFDLEPDYRTLPQVTQEDCAKMARAFLQYILAAYHFANWGQTVSWGGWFSSMTLGKFGWLTRVRLVLPTYTYLSTHSTGTLCVSWWGLGRSLRLIFFIFFSRSYVNMYFILLQTIFIHISFKYTKLYLMLLQTVSMFYLANCLFFFSWKLSSCKLSLLLSCKLSYCKLSYVFLCNVGPRTMVSLHVVQR